MSSDLNHARQLLKTMTELYAKRVNRRGDHHDDEGLWGYPSIEETKAITDSEWALSVWDHNYGVALADTDVPKLRSSDSGITYWVPPSQRATKPEEVATYSGPPVAVGPGHFAQTPETWMVKETPVGRCPYCNDGVVTRSTGDKEPCLVCEGSGKTKGRV